MPRQAEARPAAISRGPSTRGGGRRRFAGVVALAGVCQAFVVVAVLQARHDGLRTGHELAYVDPTAHWLRDSVMYAPVGVLLLWLSTLAARRLVDASAGAVDGVGASVVWAGLAAVVYAGASVPAAQVHGALFLAGHASSPDLLDVAAEAVVTLRYSFAVLLVVAMVLGPPWGSPRRRAKRRPHPTPPLPTRRRYLC